jgi:hypothetical protein
MLIFSLILSPVAIGLLFLMGHFPTKANTFGSVGTDTKFIG